MNIPKLHLKYAYPLDRERRQLFADKNFGDYPSVEEVKNKVSQWKNIWNDINKDDKVFMLLIKTISVNLQRDLEMHIFGAGLNAMSNPLIMPIVDRGGKKFADNEFIETAIHEVIHRFVGDLENNTNIEKYWETIRKEYKKESVLTQNHIMIYAVLEIVLFELFGKERLKDFINPKHPEYQRAVAIVTEKGAGNLVKQFRDIVRKSIEINADLSNYKTKTALILPFKGVWLVGNGGRDPSKNNHLDPDGFGPVSQKFAYDFIKKHKSSGKNIEDYEAFGEEVIAPAGGVTSQVINGSEDVPIGESDWVCLGGNMVVIDHENGEWSLFAHFKHDSVKIKIGDRVEQGDVLGLCGNTGNTSEPHIHYHLQDGPLMYKANGLPIQFPKVIVDGKLKENIELLERNQEVSNP